jgi:hypothetical protein
MLTKSVKFINDLDEVLPQFEIPMDFYKARPERSQMAKEAAKFLLNQTLVGTNDISEKLKTVLVAIPKEKIKFFVLDELTGIAKTLSTFKEPLIYSIKDTLKRQDDFIKHFVINNKDDKDIEFKFKAWRVLLIWDYCSLLCIYNSRRLETFYYKLKSGFIGNIISAVESNSWLLKDIFKTNIRKDAIVKDLRECCILLSAHLILSEYSYYLEIDESFSYEDFENGEIPTQHAGFHQTIESETRIDNNIKQIIQEMFLNINDIEISALINHLNGQNGYLKLTYIGKKTKLWAQLKKIRLLGIDRNIIADVFSKCCNYQKTVVAPSTKLDCDEIYNKI